MEGTAVVLFLWKWKQSRSDHVFTLLGDLPTILSSDVSHVVRYAVCKRLFGHVTCGRVLFVSLVMSFRTNVNIWSGAIYSNLVTVFNCIKSPYQDFLVIIWAVILWIRWCLCMLFIRWKISDVVQALYYSDPWFFSGTGHIFPFFIPTIICASILVLQCVVFMKRLCSWCVHWPT